MDYTRFIKFLVFDTNYLSPNRSREGTAQVNCVCVSVCQSGTTLTLIHVSQKLIKVALYGCVNNSYLQK